MTARAPDASRTEQPPDGGRTLVTSRQLAASPDQVYAAFVSADRLARWWGPKGFRNTFEAFDPRPGGAWRFAMHGPNGANFPNDSTFEALVPGHTVPSLRPRLGT